MAYKEGNPLVKLVIFAVIVYCGYRFGIPWAKEKKLLPSSESSSSRSPRDEGCMGRALAAGDAWSGGFTAFMNPPVDASAWSDFRSSVEREISSARQGCGCPEESCRKAKEALSELSDLVRNMDAAVRSSGPPTIDIVRAQERIDTLLNEARTLTNQGK
ncbi:MAG: hypothetical protein HYU52_04705 [Acidobacteria bacterium]|nr:hypothetical protein [Acidobacteriota bacterium]